MTYKMIELDSMTENELDQAFTSISLTETILDLSWNFLGFKSGAKLERIFKAIPSWMNTLDLSLNSLNEQSAAELAQAIAAIPQTVTTLGLSANYLGSCSGAELAQAFASIRPEVAVLDLSRNYFDKSFGADLANAFAVLPAGVATLVLNENGFLNKNSDELRVIFQAIPQTVIQISFLVDDLTAMEPQQLQAIQARYPYAEQIILINEKNQLLNPVLNRDDANVYARLGFKVSAPSLFDSTSFFVAKNKEKLRNLEPQFEQLLHPGLMKGINRFGG